MTIKLFYLLPRVCAGLEKREVGVCHKGAARRKTCSSSSEGVVRDSFLKGLDKGGHNVS